MNGFGKVEIPTCFLQVVVDVVHGWDNGTDIGGVA